MFTYLHCYMPQTWDAQIKAGLIRPGDGIRFCQSLDIDEAMKFNNSAAVGGDLYNYVCEHRCPLYIDRLQGGCFLEEYPYDMALVNEYRAMLGDKFWGFQMHEWGSNFKSDFHKITSNNCPEWIAEAIEATIRRAYPYEHTFVEAMNVEEYAALGGIPQTYEDYLSMMQNLFAKRQAYAAGDLLPCDSFFQAQKMEVEAGAKRLMPEIGAQTPNTRIQVAYARGMARAAGIPFGTYYEPWGGNPFSACCYQRDGLNEWNMDNTSFPFHTAGGNGGSSRSLQWRMHLYSYMAGASFMAEEWGMCNTFHDWKTFELTPYGQVKKDFLDFVDRYPDIGTPVICAAIVLPKDMPVLDMALSPNTYLGYPIDGKFAEALALAVECTSQPGYFLNTFKTFGQVETSRTIGYNLFASGQSLFVVSTTNLLTDLGDMKDDYGIVPHPKWDAEQERYYCEATAKNIYEPLACSADLERVMVIKEALAVESLNTVNPAYYDNALKNRYIRDNESLRMLELIMNTTVLDLGQDPFWDVIRTPWLDTLSSGKPNFASRVEKNMKKSQKALDKLMAMIDAIK